MTADAHGGVHVEVAFYNHILICRKMPVWYCMKDPDVHLQAGLLGPSSCQYPSANVHRSILSPPRDAHL